MAISPADLRLLFQRSGNRCAYPDCTKALDFPANEEDEAIILSEVAHIIARSPAGPRGKRNLPLEERDKYENLILLCEEHHHIVDNQPNTFTVEKLQQMKLDHEELMLDATGRAVDARAGNQERIQYIGEILHSTLLPVVEMPRYIYGVKCKYSDLEEKEVSKEIITPSDKNELYPFIIRGGMLYCFNNLRYKGGPFNQIVGDQRVVRTESRIWWDDPDRYKWYASLLNRALNKLTGRKGLYLDKKHHRYYFMPRGSWKTT